MAAIFAVKLCKAILSGFSRQLRKDGLVTDGVVGMDECEHGRNRADQIDDGSVMSVQSVEMHGHILKFDNGEGPFYDDLTKQQLPTQLVKAARRKELDYFESKNVWRRVPVSESHRCNGRPPITVRWVDGNKGDDECPDIRSRLVAQQIR